MWKSQADQEQLGQGQAALGSHLGLSQAYSTRWMRSCPLAQWPWPRAPPDMWGSHLGSSSTLPLPPHSWLAPALLTPVPRRVYN